MAKKIRRVGSVKNELINKSREAALAAVQIFNNPSITFKSESYVVLMIIAWTYLMHAHYRGKKVVYRYFKKIGKVRRFDKTKHGAYKYWELERCLNDSNSPIDKDASNNLRFLIGLRHEIEHQMTSRIDDFLSARFQACALNYNEYIKKLFGDEYSIEQHLSFSLQFSSISMEQKEMLEEQPNLPANIKGYIQDFDQNLSDNEFGSLSYAYRVLFVPKTVNKRGQADRVIEFVRADSTIAEGINKEYVYLKETEKRKMRPSEVVQIMQSEGFNKFNMYHHTQLWGREKAKQPHKGFGVEVSNTWYWYESWLEKVRKYCNQNADKYREV
ncbi:Protein of uncharacterised function (DUF3644) [Oligella ureolytica]|uniref:DUF3644 domain-containing protein n=1 Tax=Oligella ureolytica TaxID=90244 RepID=UPI000E066139|nr:DUF3644 domain-containing protein [Oligella ureolytica]SUA58543.1 Protein of uncharacterised function (DUF3644) [Oligella ureolytica]